MKEPRAGGASGRRAAPKATQRELSAAQDVGQILLDALADLKGLRGALGGAEADVRGAGVLAEAERKLKTQAVAVRARSGGAPRASKMRRVVLAGRLLRRVVEVVGMGTGRRV